MNEVRQQTFREERALFHVEDTSIVDCVFESGESPLKECRNLEIDTSLFRWKYPLWYCKNVNMNNCTLFDMARAGIWYTDNLKITDTVIEAPKNIRRVKHALLRQVSFPNAQETLWDCEDVTLEHVYAKGDYFALHTNNVKAEDFTLVGNYSFDGSKNVEMHNCNLLSKDAFWNTENVTVYDSFISGEYLGWNAKNLTLINCTIESLQGMCYIDNLVMKNCKLINTTLAFEYSTVDAEIAGGIDSVLNPSGGTIRADYIDTLILQKSQVEEGKTKLICGEIKNRTEDISW